MHFWSLHVMDVGTPLELGGGGLRFAYPAYHIATPLAMPMYLTHLLTTKPVESTENFSYLLMYSWQ